MSAAPEGHVFVTRGDLTRLACDAWLLPTDVNMTVETWWRDAVPRDLPQPPAGWGEAVRTVPAGEATGAWLTCIGTVDLDLGYLAAGVRAFVRTAAAALLPTPPRHGRARHLLALPVVGTGRGGAADRRGEVTEALLTLLTNLAIAEGVDIALVARDARAYAAAQTVRRRAGRAGGGTSWDALGDQLCRRADDLGDAARDRNLVLFLGAGLGYAAGLPGWDELLVQLARDAEASDGEIAALATLDALDQARIARDRLGGQAALGDAVRRRLAGHEQGLGHQLLASLGVREAATTNYDRRFESASAEAGRRLAILPYESAASGTGWLLKMHGCVDHPSDIVLTRDDYLGYAERRGALAGIVQALLITRRMLFVGFSLTDPNFHKIVHEVRSALGGTAMPTGPLGTALMLDDDPLVRELWGRHIEIVSLTGPTTADQARLQELFLDRLALAAMDSASHLLDPAYHGMLDDADRALKARLLELLEHPGSAARRSSAWRRVRDLLTDLGGDAAG